MQPPRRQLPFLVATHIRLTADGRWLDFLLIPTRKTRKTLLGPFNKPISNIVVHARKGRFIILSEDFSIHIFQKPHFLPVPQLARAVANLNKVRWG